MNELLEAAILKKPITDEIIAEELYDVCCREHAGCNAECPVYALNENKIPGYDENNDCTYFKNGTAMLRFIRSKI